MKYWKKSFIALFIISSAFLLETIIFRDVIFSQSVNITAEVVTNCGNNTIDGGEQCDGAQLGGQTCQSRGYSGGTLSCAANCVFNTSACASNGSGGSGGGGGGGGVVTIITTAVNFSGRAYPLSKVIILKDGQLAATTIAGPDANFNVSLSDLSGGDYTFSVLGEDTDGRRSTLFTFSVFITKGVTTSISGIFIAPTISVDKNEVKQGDNISIFGQSIPDSDITIAVNSENKFLLKTKTDKDGVYLYDFDTSPLENGDHFTKSKAALGSQISAFSKTISFLVGAKNIIAGALAKCPVKADLNNDCRVNLIDFSIAAYWYKQIISAEFAAKETERLNNDGKIDLTDFSIMAYYWTG